MSPLLTILACDRAGCQHKSNGDEASWWGVREHPEGVLRLTPYMEALKDIPDYRYLCGQVCTLAEISDWMGKQRGR